ncbi:PREDICTED: rRNA methyltransferase 3, mitochondrial-like [Branchiostoma belcheri]|uniref:rRNA methyltransferase 3, mitochondrial-like n=1 Tax=Branchiostoma belcheri TaxID=7741 RepID=A0A6P4YT45_BRABE|nr:PREDICTED: rRNA methyltransferase 3, mitochondrial-like [Branchiostoma belcheri]
MAAHMFTKFAHLGKTLLDFPIKQRTFPVLMCQRGARQWLRRRAVNVYSQEDYRKGQKGEKVGSADDHRGYDYDRSPSSPPNQKTFATSYPHVPPPQDRTSSGTVQGKNYVKLHDNDKKLAKLLVKVKSKKRRDKEGLILLEGKRLIKDAIKAGGILESLFFCHVEDLDGLPLQETTAELYKVKHKDIHDWSDTVTPQKVIAIFTRPDVNRLFSPACSEEEMLPLTLICDNIRDPGNMGTIIRSAAAAGCQKLLVTKGCVDVWESKVLRAGASAHFHLPIIKDLTWDAIPDYLPPDTVVFPADANVDVANKFTLFHPPLSTVRRSAGKRQNQIHDPDTSGDEDFELPTSLPELVAVPYYSTHWVGGSTALVVGGETEGLSLESLLLCEKTGGCRVFVPMWRGLDSLNSAVAASVVLFEAKRQHLAQMSIGKEEGIERRARRGVEPKQ